MGQPSEDLTVGAVHCLYPPHSKNQYLSRPTQAFIQPLRSIICSLSLSSYVALCMPPDLVELQFP